MRQIILTLSAAVLLVLSFPSFNCGFLAWIALIPLFVAIRDKGIIRSFFLSFLTGIVFFMGIFFWINVIKGFTLWDFLLLGIYLGSYLGAFGILLIFITRNTGFPYVIVAPVIWVSFEYLRSHAGFLALPWALLGHSQYRYLPVIQISSFAGVYGVSFLIVTVNAALYEVISFFLTKQKAYIQKNPMPLKSTVLAGVMLLASLAYGYAIISGEQEETTIPVTVIQGNIPQDIKWKPEVLRNNFEKQVQLTVEASTEGPSSLVVWPESAVPGVLMHDMSVLKEISALSRDMKGGLIFGSSQRPKFGSKEFNKIHLFNSANLISSAGVIANRYYKMHLLPFAEYLPMKGTFPWPARFVDNADNYITGSEYTLFDIKGAKFGVPICWENIFPEVFRQFVKRGANFMVNITNEGWFQETAAPYQFVSMSVFRAVENHISVIRSANTGVSCFINPFGKIMGKVRKGDKDIFVEGYLTMPVPLSYKRTFYSLHGDVFAYTDIVFALLLTVLSFSMMISRKRIARDL
jgi:apolipoprotein N-acyltransferase